MLNRIIIKLSGEAIGNESGYDDMIINSIVAQIILLVRTHVQVALVVGGGNLWRGRQAAPEMDRVKADQMGMLATVMNALYLQDAFRRLGQKAKVVTPFPVGNMTELYNKDAALEMLESGTVVINAAGLGHPLFSTDTITALRAAELDADCILFAKNTDGVYDDDPHKNPSAKKYRTLSYRTAIKNNLHVADMSALHIALEAGISSYVFSLNAHNSITLAGSYPETGNLNGTYIGVYAVELWHE
ncbi:MAG: uridine monophosphate kinase [Defluviitaleaceae bacterium]|nr:uridine monophosphate kinase [Defluviitaleaceae bacterium]MCL2264046.1 uridine monophosphate kinase [Defluviitaleaceae bacterium]